MNKQLKSFIKRNIKSIVVVLLILSVVEFIYVLTLGDAAKQIVDSLPYLVGITLVSEIMFLSGIVIMAYSVEEAIGWNPLHWRKKLKTILKVVPNEKKFWVGFWINAAGAFITGAVWVFAVMTGLPFEAWGLIWLPLTDIGLTISLRYSILELKKEKIIG